MNDKHCILCGRFAYEVPGVKKPISTKNHICLTCQDYINIIINFTLYPKHKALLVTTENKASSIDLNNKRITFNQLKGLLKCQSISFKKTDVKDVIIVMCDEPQSKSNKLTNLIFKLNVQGNVLLIPFNLIDFVGV